MNGIEFKLGEISARLKSIEQRLDDGSENFDAYDKRLLKLELVEARRAGVLAAIVALASILGGLITAYLTKKI